MSEADDDRMSTNVQALTQRMLTNTGASVENPLDPCDVADAAFAAMVFALSLMNDDDRDYRLVTYDTEVRHRVARLLRHRGRTVVFGTAH